jgi:hypothetical protein
MVKGKLITFGCSLTAHNGLKEELARLTNRQLVNLSVSAGGNGLQIHRLHEYIINNNINDSDIVLWQITGSERNSIRLDPPESQRTRINDIQKNQFAHINHQHYVESLPNIFDNRPRVDLLCNSPITEIKEHVMLFDPNQQMQTLLATLILLHNTHKKILIFFGWNDVMQENVKKIFLSTLTNKLIPYITESYLDWAIQNKKSLTWDFHPDCATGEEFAKTVIFPALNKLKWI